VRAENPLQNEKKSPTRGFFVAYFSSAVKDFRLSPYASNDLRQAGIRSETEWPL
jgi:hypothetical protein